MNTTRSGLVVTGVVLIASVAGCADDSSAADQGRSRKAGEQVTVTRPWVKAADKGDATAVFGTLRNASSAPVRVTSATSPATSTIELHETRKAEDGEFEMQPTGAFVVPANGRHRLAPGHDHIMLTNIDAPIEPGDEVRVTLVFRDGSRKTFTAPARSYSGAKESYQPESGNE